MTEFIFNRRVVDDQTIYVEAETLQEAWRKARAEETIQTADVNTRKVTLRRISEPPAQPGDA
jgi:hypothetical protein